MSDKQNTFYTSISKYYSEIFPYKAIQQKFVYNKLGGLYKKNILDIGCASGELSLKLAEQGALITGIDLNEDLLAQALENKVHANLTFQRGNMLELETDFEHKKFDAVLCFGNTLVHLQSKELVLKMLKATYAVLKDGGQLLLQILNYDHIVNEQLNGLPLIETDNIRFIRKYKFNAGSELIDFQTQLEIKQENRIVSNEAPLLALKSKDLVQLLDKAGFKNINLYANFKQDTFGGTHIPLVLDCEK